MPNNIKKGFTLIELLVVMAIIAILAIAVVLVLNPAELLRQARDSRRISDVNTLSGAISLYLADKAVSPNLAATFGYTACYLSTISGNGTSTTKCSVFAGAGAALNASANQTNYRKINSLGWLPVNFATISIGVPFATLPIDPINDANFYYAYAATSTLTFELDAFMESQKYAASGTKDTESTDGGDNNNVYETGTNLFQ